MNFNLALSLLAAVSVASSVTQVNALPFEAEAISTNIAALSLRGSEGNQNKHRDLKAKAVAGFSEKLGVCKGAVCGTWGDPHVVTCDGLQYDCQGLGIFTFMKNHMFNIQGNFVGIGVREQRDVDGWRLTEGATITNDIAIDFVANEDVPVIQLGFGEILYHGSDGNTVPSEEGCKTGVSYHSFSPNYSLGMKGFSKGKTKTLEQCRKLCEKKKKKGCSKFQWWADGDCHLVSDKMTEQVNPPHWSRVLSGSLDSDCGKPRPGGIPMVGTKNEIEKHGVIGTKEKCPLLMYLDGELTDIREKTKGGKGYLWGKEGDASSVYLDEKVITIVTEVKDYEGGQSTSSEIQLHLKGNGPGERWSCHWDFYICLPESEQDKFEEYSVGLLGSPDSNKYNDWMTPDNSVLVPQNGGRDRHKNMVDYCYDNWCVSQEESIMSYHGDTTYDTYKCKDEVYKEFDINNPECAWSPDDMMLFCINANMTKLEFEGCLVDCCWGGCTDVPEVKDLIEGIKKFSEEDEDDVPKIVYKEYNDCDATAPLLNTKDNACVNSGGSNKPLVKLLKQTGVQDLPENADVFYNIAFDKSNGDGTFANTVTFNVNNPFKVNADVYAKHDKQALNNNFVESTCDTRLSTGAGCDNNSAPIEVVCHDYPGVAPFALVQVYFVSRGVDDGSESTVTGDLDGDLDVVLDVTEIVTGDFKFEQAVVDKCCYADDVVESGVGIVEYTFEIQCACPGDSTQ